VLSAKRTLERFWVGRTGEAWRPVGEFADAATVLRIERIGDQRRNRIQRIITGVRVPGRGGADVFRHDRR
jgi:hypothetical protein